jgi:Na+-driven multidrug efflux pump
MLKTSICFSFGYVLTSTKWELMTIFARYLGPAEVTVWGLLGTLWGALEYFTAAISDASEVRTAFLLGIGQPAKARLSTYKSLYYGNFASIVVSACFFIGGDDIATWLTTDDTLQRLLAELIPLFGVGNIALTIGSMAWTLVGAQGRYHLSSAVGLSGIWLISVPLAALFSIYLNLNLQGQTASIVVGYMVSGTVNSYILFRSDWNRLSRQVVQQNAEAEHSVSSLNKEELRPVKREPGGDSHTFKAAKGMNSRHSPSNGQSSQTRSPETN